MISAYAGYNFTKNIAAEVTVSQALGTFSDTMFADFSLVHQVFPEWRISPFFALGGGVIKTDPKSTLVSTEDRQDNSLHVGGGLRFYLSKRFVLRLEYKNYVVLTSRDDDEEIEPEILDKCECCLAQLMRGDGHNDNCPERHA